MEKELLHLKGKVLERRQAWENAKEPEHVVSIFVCNRRIQKLTEAIELIETLKDIEEYSRI